MIVLRIIIQTLLNFTITLFIAFVGFMIGGAVILDYMQKEAVDHHAGCFVINKFKDKEFKWIDECPKE